MSVLVAILALAAGCTGSAADSSSRVYGRAETQIVASPGSRFAIALRANPTTGYTWQVAEIAPAGVVGAAGSEYRQDAAPPGMVGVGGEQELRFMAGVEGSATLRLVYVRPWEKDVAPADVAVFTITVARPAPRD